MEKIPLIVVFAITNIVIILFVEAGYRMGHVFHTKEKNEKESPVSSISGSILGLLVFMLAFTFGIVSEKFEDRKDTLRQEANSIGTLWLRTDFMPEPDRTKTRVLIRKYVNIHLDIFNTPDHKHLETALTDLDKLQQQIWMIAAPHARTDMASDVGALYFDSLNSAIDNASMRVAIALETQIPTGIWIAFFFLLILGMFSVGYATAAAESSRTIVSLVLALSFSVVITLIAAMDSPLSKFISIPQSPMEAVRQSISQQ